MAGRGGPKRIARRFGRQIGAGLLGTVGLHEIGPVHFPDAVFEHLRILPNPALRVPLYGADRNWSDAEPDLTLGVKPPKILIPTVKTVQ